MYLKALLKDKKQVLNEKLASEVEKTNQWKKETLLILSKHETVFNERKAKYDMHPLAQQRWKDKMKHKQMDIMVNIQTKALEDAKKKFYKLNQILEQMSRVHIVQMAKAYISCHQAMKRKSDMAANLRNQKQEVEKLKNQKENIFIDGLKIKTHTAPQAQRPTSSKQRFEHLYQSVTPTSLGATGSRSISPRITLDNIPRLQLPGLQGTPPKMPRFSSFSGTSHGFSSPLTKMLTSTLSLFKSNPLRSAANTGDKTLKVTNQGFGENEQQSSQEPSPSVKLSFTPTEKQNEMSAASSSAENVECRISLDNESNSTVKPAEDTIHNRNSTHELEVQDLNVAREERMNKCNVEHPVLNRSNEREYDSITNIKENMAEKTLQPTEPQDNLIPIRKWKKSSPEYHLKPFSISSATKLNAKQNIEKSSYFEQRAHVRSDLQTNSINIQEEEHINELAESIAEPELPKESEEKSAGTVSKILQNNDDCIPCTPLISPPEHSNSSGTALTRYDLSPNSYAGTDGYQSPNMDTWSPTNTSPEAAGGSSQPQAAERINIFDGTSIPSNQAFSLAFDFGSSAVASSSTTMLFGENEGDKGTSKGPKQKDDGSNFNFGFQPIFKMF